MCKAHIAFFTLIRSFHRVYYHVTYQTGWAFKWSVTYITRKGSFPFVPMRIIHHTWRHGKWFSQRLCCNQLGLLCSIILYKLSTHLIYVPLSINGWFPCSTDNNMGMKYQVIGKIFDRSSPDRSPQDAEMMNLDLDCLWPSRNDVQSHRSLVDALVV